MTENTPDMKPEENKTPEWANKLQATMETVGTGISSLVELAKQSQTRRPAEPEPDPEPEDGSDLLAVQDLEVIPRRNFAERILQTFEQSLEGKLKPLTEAIQKQGNDLLTSHYVREAEAFAARTPDFREWTEEMAKIAEENPHLQMSRIYAIAKSENPDKAVKIAEKYKKDTDAGTKPPPVVKKKPLSLSPTSSPTGDVKNTRMNAEDASKDAWEKAVAQFGNLWKDS